LAAICPIAVIYPSVAGTSKSGLPGPHQLAKLPEFVTSVNQKNIHVRMADRMLVLRFLAFYQLTYLNARRGLKKFLNDFLETYSTAAPEKLGEFENAFRKAMRASVTIFGDKGFRVRQTGGKGEWGSRVNAAIFQTVSVSFTAYDAGALTRSADAVMEEFLDLLSTDPKWIESVSATTGDFARIEYAFTTWNERLKKVMAAADPNDKRRLFSRQLKEELFEQDSDCAICGQRIKLLHDSALDHDRHYWLGGKTVPDNARLVHRQCNLERPRT
jgi:hypothetical protein